MRKKIFGLTMFVLLVSALVVPLGVSADRGGNPNGSSAIGASHANANNDASAHCTNNGCND